ncbi:hypothetical protein [Flagellimonas sp. 2504JD4-2]
MWRIRTIFIIFLIGTIHSSHGQTYLNNNSLLEGYKDISQEKVFIHYNTSLALVGERIYYKVYCLEEETNKFSNLSKAAYVELVGVNNQTVFKHKIRLESGLGNGDFFIPAEVSSGHYKIIGYTRWMLNKGQDSFFQGNITVINPYQNNQDNILIVSKDSVGVQSSKKDYAFSEYKKSKYISLETDSKVYGKREPVSLGLKSVLGENDLANFSISVRKMDVSENYKAAHAENFAKTFKRNEPNNNKTIFLPELRGELFRGKVLDKESKLPLQSKQVALSSIGDNFQLSVSDTNHDGVFYFNLEEENPQNEVIVQVLGESRSNCILQMDTEEYVDYDKLSFEKVEIASESLDAIFSRSINSQFENAYTAMKADSTILREQASPFYTNLSMLYNLDDYTRFPTVKETIVEVVDNAWIEKNKNGESVFKVKYFGPYLDLVTLPLVIVDGTMVQNHNQLVDYEARKIQSIGLYWDKFRIGPEVFQGAILVETINGDFNISTDEDYIVRKKLLRPLLQKKYYQQSYQGDLRAKYERIPDFRSQLLWEPDISLADEEITLEFYTSDVSGTYGILLEGFTANGHPISITKTIAVE